MMQSRISDTEWTDEMSVGIPEMDEEHKRFLDLVNGLSESIINRLGVTEVKKRLQDILDDATEHFELEERLFKEFRYPQADAHTAKHAELIEAIRHLESTIEFGIDFDWIDAALTLKESLIIHIQTEDMRYAEFYRNLNKAP
ncbi:MAG: bacteriohemerythrin [Georgfuchsia sp.]